MPIGEISLGQIVCLWLAWYSSGISRFRNSCGPNHPRPKETFHICLSEGVKENIKWNTPFLPQVSFCWKNLGFWRLPRWRKRRRVWTAKNSMWFSAQLICSGEKDKLGFIWTAFLPWLNTVLLYKMCPIMHCSHIANGLLVGYIWKVSR